jgi:hypothetical protein
MFSHAKTLAIAVAVVISAGATHQNIAPPVNASLARDPNPCNEFCNQLNDGVNKLYGYGCVGGNQGSGCVATTTDCHINQVGCDDPGAVIKNEDFIIADDGHIESSVKLCAFSGAIHERRIGFAHLRQWSALAQQRDVSANVPVTEAQE